MNEFTILTYNNYVGIVTDAILLKNLIETKTNYKVNINYIDNVHIDKANVGIWIQNFNIELLNNFKKNIFFINEEWAGIHELSNLHLFDHVICKSNYAKKLLEPYCDAIHLPFISKDYYNSQVDRSNKILHFVGRSIQKNTELVLSQTNHMTIIDPFNRYNVSNNVNHINTYQTSDQISELLNSHNTHICCSLYESWGHYLFEGLSTGAEIICSEVPVFKEQLDPDLIHFITSEDKTDLNYCYCSDNINNTFPIRKSFFVNENEFKNSIENFSPKGNSRKRRELYKFIYNRGVDNLYDFFKNV